MSSHSLRFIGLIVAFCSQLITIPMAIPNMAQVVNSTDRNASTQREAGRLWEQLIAAKGGRERLYAVHNIVISSRGQYNRGLKTNPLREEAIYVFPNKVWSWRDYRPDVFGLVVKMINYDSNMEYIITPDAPHAPPMPITDRQNRYSLMFDLLEYLPETKWLKPVPVKASKARIGLRTMDVVQTRVGGKRVDFALDSTTHLPVKVSFYDSLNSNANLFQTVNLSDYTEVNGIKIPQRLESRDGSTDNVRVQFNVAYDESIFVTLSPIAAGAEAWKPKR